MELLISCNTKQGVTRNLSRWRGHKRTTRGCAGRSCGTARSRWSRTRRALRPAPRAPAPQPHRSAAAPAAAVPAPLLAPAGLAWGAGAPVCSGAGGCVGAVPRLAPRGLGGGGGESGGACAGGAASRACLPEMCGDIQEMSGRNVGDPGIS